MLAVFIETDPKPILVLLGLDIDLDEFSVHRESALDSGTRPDLVLISGGRPVAVIEVKVLAGLGRSQLDRYAAAEPGAQAYVVVFPRRLFVDTRRSPLV